MFRTLFATPFSSAIRTSLSTTALLCVAAGPAFADDDATALTQPSPAASTTTTPATAPPTTPATAPTTTPTTAPHWQVGIGVPNLFVAGQAAASVDLERRLTDDLWLTFNVFGQISHTETPVDGDDPVVSDTIGGGGDIGVRWFVLTDGRIRPSLRARAGTSIIGTVGSNDVSQNTYRLSADAGVDVDVFLIDNVAFRLGTSIVGVSSQWGQHTIDGVTSDDISVVEASLIPRPSASLQVYF